MQIRVHSFLRPCLTHCKNAKNKAKNAHENKEKTAIFKQNACIIAVLVLVEMRGVEPLRLFNIAGILLYRVQIRVQY